MLVRLLSNQIAAYEDVINEAIDKTIPLYQDSLRTKLFNELLLGTAQAWELKENGHSYGLFITKVEEDTACGGRKFTLISGYVPGGMENKSASVFDGWQTMSKFAKVENCDRIAMYTSNQEVIKYLTMFNIIWETKYFEIELDREI